LRLHSAGQFSAPKIFSSAFRRFHCVPEIQFSPIQISSEGAGATVGDLSGFRQFDFAHEIGDLVFLEVAADKVKGLFGNEQVFGIGRENVGPVAQRIDQKEPLRRNAENVLNYSYLGKL
jgi:hypothetical protein